MTKQVVIPERILAARKLTGLSLAKFIDFIGSDLDRQALDRYEKGTINMKPKFLPPFARAFNVPESFFMGDGFRIDGISLRKSVANAEISEEDYKVLKAQLALCLERFKSAEKRSGKKVQPERVRYYKVTPEKAADRLRSLWELGNAPITSVMSLLECHGIRVFSCYMPKTLLGASTTANRCIPVIALNSDKNLTTNCRTRMTALHELGHLVISMPNEPNPEKACNKFAACMLIPRKALVRELGEHTDSISEYDAVRIHRLYGISVAALIHQAFDFGIISEEHYHWWFENKIKYDHTESLWGDYPFEEQPTMETSLSSY